MNAPVNVAALNANEHYAEAARLIDDPSANTNDLLRAIAHSLLALVETEENGAHELHAVAEAIQETVVVEAEGGQS